MKRIVLFSALFSTFILAGCQAGETSLGATEETDTASQVMVDTTQDSTAAVEEETIEEERVAYTHEVNSATFTIDPIEEDGETKVALLTFDDAPDGNAVQIAETLHELGAPAIFFVNGMYLESEEGKEDLQTIYDMGFEIGNHTYTHPVLTQISEEEQREEIVRTNDVVEEIIGVRPRFFRAPHGVNSDYSRQVAEEEGMVLMNWTYGYDWEPDYQDPEALADIMLNTPYLNDGANLLMHDRTWTRDAVADITTGLEEKGYTLIDPKLIYSPEREVSAE